METETQVQCPARIPLSFKFRAGKGIKATLYQLSIPAETEYAFQVFSDLFHLYSSDSIQILSTLTMYSACTPK